MGLEKGVREGIGKQEQGRHREGVVGYEDGRHQDGPTAVQKWGEESTEPKKGQE